MKRSVSANRSKPAPASKPAGASEEFVTPQTYVPDSLHQALKGHALLTRQRVTDIYEEAIEEFLGSRRTLLQRGEPVDYFARRRSEKQLNLRFSAELGQRADAIAEEDGISTSRLFYTALVLYARKRSLLPLDQQPARGAKRTASTSLRTTPS